MENTKTCKFCTKEIAKDAKRCPECGGDLRNWFARHKILTGLLVLIVLGVYFAIQSDKEDEHARTQATEVSVEDLYNTYDQNEAKGNQTFKDKFVKLTGTVQSVDGNLTDTSSIIKIDTPDEYDLSPIWCHILEADTQSNNLASKLSEGNSVTVTGKVDGILLGSIMLRKCKVEE